MISLNFVTSNDTVSAVLQLVAYGYEYVRVNQGPVSQRVWHDKDPSLLNPISAEHRLKIALLRRQWWQLTCIVERDRSKILYNQSTLFYIALTASKDGTIRLWDVVLGLHVAMIDMHFPVLNCLMSEDCCKIVVHLENCKRVPLLCLHNCPEPCVSPRTEPHFNYANRNEGTNNYASDSLETKMLSDVCNFVNSFSLCRRNSYYCIWCMFSS